MVAPEGLGDRHEAATIHQPSSAARPWSLRARAQKPIPLVGLLTSLSAADPYRSMLSIKGGMDVTISANGSVLPERRTELVRYDDVQIEVVFEGNGPAVVLPSAFRL